MEGEGSAKIFLSHQKKWRGVKRCLGNSGSLFGRWRGGWGKSVTFWIRCIWTLKWWKWPLDYFRIFSPPQNRTPPPPGEGVESDLPPARDEWEAFWTPPDMEEGGWDPPSHQTRQNCLKNPQIFFLKMLIFSHFLKILSRWKHLNAQNCVMCPKIKQKGLIFCYFCCCFFIIRGALQHWIFFCSGVACPLPVPGLVFIKLRKQMIKTQIFRSFVPGGKKSFWFQGPMPPLAQNKTAAWNRAKQIALLQYTFIQFLRHTIKAIPDPNWCPSPGRCASYGKAPPQSRQKGAWLDFIVVMSELLTSRIQKKFWGRG